MNRASGVLDVRSGSLYRDQAAAHAANVPDACAVLVYGSDEAIHRVALACILEARRRRRMAARLGDDDAGG